MNPHDIFADARRALGDAPREALGELWEPRRVLGIARASRIVPAGRAWHLGVLLLGEDGGPGGRGMVPGLWMFNRAFFAGEFGYACAIGLILFVFILALTWVNHRYVRVEK